MSYRSAVKVVSKYAKGKTATTASLESAFQPAYARLPRQPVHPAAWLKQSRRWISTKSAETARQFGTTTTSPTTRAHYASSRIGLAISQSSGRAPFASTLRPNLTGGAIPRTQGGYTLGGGRRYFSHSPAPAAEVIQNVGQAMRAFMLGGKQLQYDGTDPRTGEKRFRTVTALQDKATRNLSKVTRSTPGSFIDFNVNPTITAMAPTALSSVASFSPAKTSGMDTLHSEGLLDILSIDFSRALQELAYVMADLRSLSSLGDLPISYQHNRLRVHFPGVDPETVESLAAELGIKRGVVGQDEEFDNFVGTEIALLFPFASSTDASTSSLYALQGQAQPLEFDALSSSMTLSDTGLANDDLDQLSVPSNEYESLPETIETRSLAFNDSPSSTSRNDQRPFEYQDFEGIYRFIELCDNARR